MGDAQRQNCHIPATARAPVTDLVQLALAERLETEICSESAAVGCLLHRTCNSYPAEQEPTEEPAHQPVRSCRPVSVFSWDPLTCFRCEDG